MENQRGRVLYVGKAVRLRARVQSHLRHHIRPQKIHRNLLKVHRIRWLQTPREIDALVLEETLIREYRPPYNVVEPEYRFLRLTLSETFPRLEVVAGCDPGEGDAIFGPYPDLRARERLVGVLLPVFRIRPGPGACSWDGESRRSPCHRFDLGWCSAPCAARVSEAVYRTDALALASVLGGEDTGALGRLAAAAHDRLEQVKQERSVLVAAGERLWKEMEWEAEADRYEEAAQLRNRWTACQQSLKANQVRERKLRKQIAGLTSGAETPSVVLPGLPATDLMGITFGKGFLALTLLPYRGGRLLKPLQETGSLEEIAGYLRRHYRRDGPRPEAVVLVRDITSDHPAEKLVAAADGVNESWIDHLLARGPLGFNGSTSPQILPAEPGHAWDPAVELVRLNLRALLRSAGGIRRAETHVPVSRETV